MSSACPHISTLGDYTKEDITRRQQQSQCDQCNVEGPNLWVCLHRNCLFVGCGENHSDHSTKHFEALPLHSLTLNLLTLRVWCYLCEREVFLENNDPPLPGMLAQAIQIPESNVFPAEPDAEDDEVDNHDTKPRGLTGLQNLGNTCYINAAIQALSNCPPLTQFFMDCGSFVKTDKKPGLARSYMKLMNDMWHKQRPSYVVPSGIAHGIKMVFPVFRGYTQQDTQEFLRCFMDQLHEELKDPVVDLQADLQEEEMGTLVGVAPQPVGTAITVPVREGGALLAVSEESSQSEAEFETCDSGLSSEKSSRSGDLPYEAMDEEAVIIVGEGGNAGSVATGYGNGTEYSQPGELTDHMHAEDGSKETLNSSGLGSSLDRARTPASTPVSTSSIRHTSSSASGKKASTFPRFGSSNIYFGSGKAAQQQSQQQQQQQQQSHVQQQQQRRKPVTYRSIISDIFDGKILSSVQCLTCDTVSTTKETFQDLSLPIPTRDHLHLLHASHQQQQQLHSAASPVASAGVGHHASPAGQGIGTSAIPVTGKASQGRGSVQTTCSDVYSHQGWFSWIVSWFFSWIWGPTVSLQDCLSAFFSADELKGDNMYSCDKCKKLRNGIKYSKVLKLPEILCIHLKRFRHEVMFSSKISSYVSFPMEGLDMSKFLHKDCSSGVTTYDLIAVICHHGTAGSGHYTAYALNYLNDQWYEFDDQYVTAVDPQVVQNCEAYVLFYRKSCDDMMKKRQLAVELMERSKTEPGLLHFFISKQWVNRFNTFAEPGPITNTDFLCSHGGVHPNIASHVEELCTVLSQAVWEYLHDTRDQNLPCVFCQSHFGGGPPCNHLFICPTCQGERECLERRRRHEMETFTLLNKEYQGAQESPQALYALSLNWFKQWEMFARGKVVDPPGPIDNSSICSIKNGQPFLKPISDYGSISGDLWRFFVEMYGGGPELLLQQAMPTSCSPPTNSQRLSSQSGFAQHQQHLQHNFGSRTVLPPHGPSLRSGSALSSPSSQYTSSTGLKRTADEVSVKTTEEHEVQVNEIDKQL